MNSMKTRGSSDMTSPSAQKAAGEIGLRYAWSSESKPVTHVEVASIIQQAITEAVDAAVAQKDKRVKELEEHVRTLCECLKSDPEMAFDYTHQIAQAEKALEAPHEPREDK